RDEEQELNGKLRGSDVGTVAAVVAEDACEVAEENEVLADATVLVAAVVAVDDAGEAEEEDDETLLEVRVLVEAVVELEIVVMGRLLRSWARISGFDTGVGTVVP